MSILVPAAPQVTCHEAAEGQQMGRGTLTGRPGDAQGSAQGASRGALAFGFMALSVFFSMKLCEAQANFL